MVDPNYERFLACSHPNAKPTEFDPKVYRCEDCKAHIRPADVPPLDQGSSVIGPLLGWAVLVLFLIAIVLGAVAAVTHGEPISDIQYGVPSPQPLSWKAMSP